MLFTISESACTRCGLCVEVCPARIIEQPANSYPKPVTDAQNRCISCGHCVAVCPHDALSLENMPVEKCPPVNNELLVSPERLEHIFRARRSIRAFKDAPVDREELSKLIEIARYAPTGSNSQQVKWIVVYENENVNKISRMVANYFRSEIHKDPMSPGADRLQTILSIYDTGYDYICRGAPHLVLAYAPDTRGPGDSIIAATYLELAAFSAGLGPCWGGFIMAAGRNKWPELQDFLDLPAGHTLFAAMMIGHPKYAYKRLPLRNEAQIKWID